MNLCACNCGQLCNYTYVRGHHYGKRAHPPVSDAAKREQRRRHKYLARYGVTFEHVEAMRAASTGCEICGSADPGGHTGQFHLDHNHATGQVRGLLCKSCNHALGFLKDSRELLQSAITYLDKYEDNNESS